MKPRKLCRCTKILGRPPEGATRVEMLTENGWVSDDGRAGTAFSGILGHTPYAWYGQFYHCYSLACPAERAMRRTSERFGAANGGVMVATKKPREFIGTYPCVVCTKKVRVYDWLPQCVLCSRCNREADRMEKAMAAP